MANEVAFLLKARDEASAVMNRMSKGTTDALSKIESGVAKLVKRFKFFIAAGVAAAGYAFVRTVKDAVRYGVEMDKLTKATGISTEAMGKLAYAAQQEHASLETLTKAIPILSKYAAYAAEGMETYSREFDKMGVKVTDSKGKLKDVYDIFLEMSDFFAGPGASDTEKLAIAMTLLGRRGAELIPFMKLGRTEFEKLGNEAKRLGLILSTEDAAAMKEFDDSLTRAKGSIRGVGIAIAKDMINPLEGLTEWLSTNLPIIKDDFQALGTTIGIVAAPVIGLVMGVNELSRGFLVLARTAAQVGDWMTRDEGVTIYRQRIDDINAAILRTDKSQESMADLIDVLKGKHIGTGEQTKKHKDAVEDLGEEVANTRQEMEKAIVTQKDLTKELIGKFEWEPAAMAIPGYGMAGRPRPAGMQVRSDQIVINLADKTNREVANELYGALNRLGA